MNTKTRLYPVIFALLGLLIVSCAGSAKPEAAYGDYISGVSLDTDSILTALGISDKDKHKGAMDSANQLDDPVLVNNKIPQNRNDLNSMKMVYKVYDGSTDAGLTIPGFGGIKLGKDEKNLNTYFIETKVVNGKNGAVVYGIGYSIHYLFKKVKKGLDISNLPSIAASVQLESKKTQVLYSLQTHGIIGVNLVKYFKPTVNKSFDVDGFGIMQSSIDGIQNILGDSVLSKSVKFTPQILSFVNPSDL